MEEIISLAALLAVDRQATVEDQCIDDVCDDQTGIDAAAEGSKLVAAGTVGFVAGAVHDTVAPVAHVMAWVA